MKILFCIGSFLVIKYFFVEAGNEKKSQKNDSKIIIIENQIINNLNQDRSQSAIISVSGKNYFFPHY